MERREGMSWEWLKHVKSHFHLQEEVFCAVLLPFG